MGDTFQIFVDREVSIEDAAALAQAVRDWLVNDKIIQARMTDCVLGNEGQGYPPGLNASHVTEFDRAPHFMGLRTNGLAIIIGRMVYTSGQGET